MAEPIKRMDVAEFRALGFLQEVNRLVLHPAGLALEVRVDVDEHGVETETFGAVWDYRDDPEGIAYGEGMIEIDKVHRVRAEVARHEVARVELLGEIVQSPPAT